jgi:hypothetical protein
MLQGALNDSQLVEQQVVEALSQDGMLIGIEADVFWCLNKLVSDI